MRYGSPLMIKAVFTLWVGVAFFLAGCVPKPPSEVPRPKQASQGLFNAAEKYFHAGQYEKAVELYQRYLEANPRGENSRLALYRMAGIAADRYRYKDSLALLKRIIREYPNHPELPRVTYDLAHTYYRMGDYQQAKKISEEWLGRYPSNHIRGDVLFLLGNALSAMGDTPAAFQRWLQASKSDWGIYNASAMRKEVRERILDLINGASLQDLKAMEPFARGSAYAPPLYHKMALALLQENRLPEAKAAAAALVRSTPEQHWVDLGREILERVEEALSVKPGAVGCLLPLSGPFAIYGQEVLNGILLGLDPLKPGEGANLELLIRDTHGEPDQAVSQLEDLVKTEHVITVIGPLASKPASAVAKSAQELGVPIITLTQKEGVTQEGDMVFRNFLTPNKEIDSLVNAAVNGLGMKRFGILFPDNSYGRFFMNLFWDKVDAAGGRITAVESYKPGQTDFAVQIKKMVGLYYPRPAPLKRRMQELRYLRAEEHIDFNAQGQPEPIVDFDAVFIPDSSDMVAIIAPQFPFHNVFGIRLLGTSIWQSPELIRSAGDYVQGAIFPTSFFAGQDKEAVKNFVERYQENFESEPGVLAATGYDTMQFVKHLLSAGNIRTRRDFQEGLCSYQGFSGVMGKLAFTPEGEAEKEPLLLTVAGHQFTPLPLSLRTPAQSLLQQPASGQQFERQ